MKTRTQWLTVLVAAVIWTAACVISWPMPLATRLAVGLTGAAALLILTIKVADRRL
jgi:hypothetical protein